MADFALTFEQWSQRGSIPFQQLGAVLNAYPEDTAPPVDQWQRVRELTLRSLSEHTLTPQDDPESVLGTLINARAFCGSNRDITSDEHYTQIKSCVEGIRGAVEFWPINPHRSWMLAALDADTAVTDLRRSSRGFIEADYRSIADRCLRYFSTIVEIDESTELSENYQNASREMTPRVLDWLLCSLPHLEDYAEKMEVVFEKSVQYLKSCQDSSKRDIRFTSLAAITEGLLDAAVNETGEMQSKLLELSRRAISIVEGIVDDRTLTPEGSSRAIELAEFKDKLGKITGQQ